MAALGPRRTRGVAPPRPPAATANAWATVFGQWESVVGPGLARHVAPQRLDGDALVVTVDSPPWATQVRVLAPQILAKVAEISGEAPARLEVSIRRK